MMVFDTKAAFKYLSELSREQYRKRSRQSIFVVRIDIFQGIDYIEYRRNDELEEMQPTSSLSPVRSRFIA